MLDVCEGWNVAISRRALLGAAAGVAAGSGLTACGSESSQLVSSTSAKPSPATTAPVTPESPAGSLSPTSKVIGDGSTQDTGPQPHQPAATRLAPGEQPPQFVVMSWDGAGETNAKLVTRFRSVAKQLNGSMTFFLSGIYTLPEHKKTFYRPPRHPIGASDIGYLSDESVHATIEQAGLAWTDGHEIGTHFNGHFCGPSGVDAWSPADWKSEIDQAIAMVTQWRTNTGFTDLPSLPFDYRKELTGGRTPCLQGGANLRRTAKQLNWRYDSSGTGTQVWPTKFSNGLWNVPMQAIPFPGHSFEVLAMDYNMMFNQSVNTNGDSSKRPMWQAQARDAFLAGFRRAYGSNRAPLIIGNHFERWNGGIYMEAVVDAVTQMAQHNDVRFVSFRQLLDWIEAQDPKVVRRLQSLPVGTKPTGGWAEYLHA